MDMKHLKIHLKLHHNMQKNTHLVSGEPLLLQSLKG